MRQHPREDSDVVSQALFSEQVIVSHHSAEWLHITTPDGYSGWVRDHGIVSQAQYTTSHRTSRISSPLYIEKGISKGPLMFLPFGTGIHVINFDSDWAEILLPSGRILYIQSGNLSSSQILQRENLEKFTHPFLGLPYVWGGRSSFGFDCSGFIQMVYREMGISLPRDSSEQIKVLEELPKEKLSVGDLIFWGASLQKIGHVGCFLGEDRFIHATGRENQPWLRISLLTDPAWNCGEKSIYPYRCFRKS